MLNIYTSFILIFACLFSSYSEAIDYAHQHCDENLMRDLLIVDYWNKKINERLPVFYNNILSGGYFNMPSARMGCEGEISAGYAKVPPYRNYNLRIQLMDRLEISGSYRIFKGVDDPILTPLGFGDLSDKGANVKLAILHPEDSQYLLPGIAVGLEDFMGTKGFEARYVVMTKVFLDLNTEITLGYGDRRIKGFFGGITVMPFRKSCLTYLENFALSAEYDATPYCDPEIERHPKGRVKRSPINYGIKLRLFDHLDLSLSRIRGDEWSWSVSSFYNFGQTKGFLPKFNDTLPYKGPFNTHPLGCSRKEAIMAEEFRDAFINQGFELLEVKIYNNECGQKTLRLRVDNLKYALEAQVRERLNYLLGYLVPDNIDLVIVVIDERGLAIHQYEYAMPYVKSFIYDQICEYELKILTPLKEVTFVKCEPQFPIFKTTRNLFNFELLPKTHSFFGSSKGKFKYAVGLNAGINGFLPGDIYYSALLGYTFLSNLGDLTGVDRLNPSQLINVRTDIIRYYQQKGLTFDRLYLQKNWNLGKGIFTRLSVGYFEEAYGGIASEVLYFPINSPWAFGVQGAILKKRNYNGLGFTNQIRKLNGFCPTYQRFLGSQLLLNAYYDWKAAGVDFKISAGQFLAKDLGIRYEITRHFPSGLRVSVWLAHTNGRDRINDKTYYDKGIALSMPLDIFYTYSDRDRWRYGLSAWLRDVAVIAETGDDLYNMIYEQRNNR